MGRPCIASGSFPTLITFAVLGIKARIRDPGNGDDSCLGQPQHFVPFTMRSKLCLWARASLLPETWGEVVRSVTTVKSYNKLLLGSILVCLQ